MIGYLIVALYLVLIALAVRWVRGEPYCAPVSMSPAALSRVTWDASDRAAWMDAYRSALRCAMRRDTDRFAELASSLHERLAGTRGVHELAELQGMHSMHADIMERRAGEGCGVTFWYVRRERMHDWRVYQYRAGIGGDECVAMHTTRNGAYADMDRRYAAVRGTK